MAGPLTELNAETIRSTLSKEMPSHKCVLIGVDGDAKEVIVDMTPSKQEVSKLLGGALTFLGQYEPLGVLVVVVRDGFALPVNAGKLPEPFKETEVHGPIILTRSDENGNPLDFALDEYKEFAAKEPEPWQLETFADGEEDDADDDLDELEEEEEEDDDDDDDEVVHESKRRKFKLYQDSFTKEYISDPVRSAKAIFEDVTKSEEDKAAKLAPEEIKKLITKMTRYLLLHGSKKIPIDRKKLGDIMGEYKKSKITKFVLGEAQRLLRSIWGYDIVPAPPKRNQKVEWSAKWRDSFFLVRRQQSPAHVALLAPHVSDDEKRERAFLMCIFACIISAHDHKLRDRDLFKYLNHLDPNIPRDPPSGPKKEIHVTNLGNLSDLFDRAINYGYLLKEVDTHNDTIYALGPRAMVDVGRNQILQFQADALGHESLDNAILKEMQDNAKIDDSDDEDSQEEEEQQPPPKKSKDATEKKGAKQSEKAAAKAQAVTSTKKKKTSSSKK
mmetsp:Transcript_19124/g.23549  ORF Transcript_19124/g.23549 Transcript_19124/m.23549 type:complete len:499 (+) Transcript_19124:23-1519(+)